MSVPLSPEQIFAAALSGELRNIGLPIANRREHQAGMAMARQVGLADYINRLCNTWAAHFVPETARRGGGEYEVTNENLFVIEGDGSPDRPYFVVVESFDHLVHEIKQGQVFRRFQVPRIESLERADRVYALAGPSPIGEDQTWSHPQYLKRRILQLFIDGKLSKKVPFCIDTDSPYFTENPLLRYELVGTPRDPRNPPRAIWTFTSPSPRTDLHTFVDGQPLNHQGQLGDRSLPAQSVEWTLEIDVLGQPLTVWKIVFSRKYADARRRAEAFVRQAAAMQAAQATIARRAAQATIDKHGRR
ncbi:hypothetical protein JCM10449v2_004060 [Rhodotorula kratochvilovae]